MTAPSECYPPNGPMAPLHSTGMRGQPSRLEELAAEAGVQPGLAAMARVRRAADDRAREARLREIAAAGLIEPPEALPEAA